MKKLKLYGLYCFAIIFAVIGIWFIYLGFASGRLEGIYAIIIGFISIIYSVLILNYRSINVAGYVFDDWWRGPL